MTVATTTVLYVALATYSQYMAHVVELMRSTWTRRFMMGDVAFEPSEGRLGAKEQQFIDAVVQTEGDFVLRRVRFLETDAALAVRSRRAPVLAVGYDVEEGRMLRGEWGDDAVLGRPLGGADEGAVVIGKTLARLLGCRETEPLSGVAVEASASEPCLDRPAVVQLTTAGGRLDSASTAVVGMVDAMFRELDARALMMPLARLQRLTGTNGLSRVTVSLRDPGRTEALAESWNRRAVDAGLNLVARPWWGTATAELYRRSVAYLDVCRLYLLLMMSIVGAMVTLAMIQRLASAHARGFATMRALGFRDRDVERGFVVEVVSTSAAGLLIGLLVTWGLSYAINSIAIPYQLGGLTEKVPFEVGYDAWVYGKIGGIFVVTSAVSATVVVRRRLNMGISGGLSASA